MDNFQLFASPWWVNFLILVPFLLFIYWRKHKLDIPLKMLLFITVFGIAFGYLENACVVYLRGATGLLPGYMQSLTEIQRQSIGTYNQLVLQKSLPTSLLIVEILREVATMIMLLSIPFIAVKKMKERVAIFLWTFAVWDIFYYVFLYLLVRWPEKFTTMDVLFLIPQPWFSQVWFPLLISFLSLLAILLNLMKSKKTQA